MVKKKKKRKRYDRAVYKVFKEKRKKKKCICIDVDVVVYVVLRRYFVKSMENQQKSMTTSFIVDIIHCQAKQHERKLNRKGLLLYYVTIQDFKSQCVKFSAVT